jgi:Methyltransferase domain/C-methyltransferase C-terminal domain
MVVMVDTGDECTACGSSSVSGLFEIRDIPIYCNIPQPNRDAALNVPKDAIDLGYCEDCGHLLNLGYDSKKIDYVPGYENSLDYSPRFREYAASLANRLVERYDVRGKQVIEIACGRGEFLKMLCRFGGNRGYGFDPSYSGDGCCDEGITLVRDYYSKRYGHYDVALVCCRHALEHIPKPIEFLSDLRETLKGKHYVHVYFEVPNSLHTLKNLSVWDLIYEHCSYFSRCSLTAAFSASGFAVEEVAEEYGGQFLGIWAHTPMLDEDLTQQNSSCAERVGLSEYVRKFEKKFHSKVESWARRLSLLSAAGERAVIWGAGSKGVTFLNILNVHDVIEYVVDVNPHKKGLFVPGAGQTIVDPEFLREYRPETVIIMNSIYRDEIKRILREMGLRPKLLVA